MVGFDLLSRLTARIVIRPLPLSCKLEVHFMPFLTKNRTPDVRSQLYLVIGARNSTLDGSALTTRCRLTLAFGQLRLTKGYSILKTATAKARLVDKLSP